MLLVLSSARATEQGWNVASRRRLVVLIAAVAVVALASTLLIPDRGSDVAEVAIPASGDAGSSSGVGATPVATTGPIAVPTTAPLAGPASGSDLLAQAPGVAAPPSGTDSASPGNALVVPPEPAGVNSVLVPAATPGATSLVPAPVPPAATVPTPAVPAAFATPSAGSVALDVDPWSRPRLPLLRRSRIPRNLRRSQRRPSQTLPRPPKPRPRRLCNLRSSLVMGGASPLMM